MQNAIKDLAVAIETAERLDPDLAARAVQALRQSFPAEAAAGLIAQEALSTDALLALVQAALPGWHFKLHGRARPAGGWTCSLRRSDVLDDDDLLGTGDADSLPQAILAAILRIAALK